MRLFINYYFFFLVVCFPFLGYSQPLRVLNFYGSCGFEHKSQPAGVQMVEEICKRNGWLCTSVRETLDFTPSRLGRYDVVVFNNNCGDKGRIFNDDEQKAFQSFIRNGGGFVGIHCAGALWHEGGTFQQWYEKLLGTKLIDHPSVQLAECIVEDTAHTITNHLPRIWHVTEEFHRMEPNPRARAHVLMSVNENSYQGVEKMGGDHPIVWLQEFDGGRSFFSTLGHTDNIYTDSNYVKIIEEGIKWTAKRNDLQIPGLVVDLDADKGVVTDENGSVKEWINQVAAAAAETFVENNKGRKEAGSGRPKLMKNISQLNGRNAIAFSKQELVSHEEDAFDSLITGNGYTWLCVLKAAQQSGELENVNSFFGTLRNGENYEGFWAGLNDDNRVWMGSRNGKTFGRWDQNNPKVLSADRLRPDRYYLLVGLMEQGKNTVGLSLFINDIEKPVAQGRFPVNDKANASKLVIGQERDATEHPGRESFIGEIARFQLYNRPLSYKELKNLAEKISREYSLDPNLR